MRELVPLIGLPLKAELAQQIFLTWDIGKCSGVWSILCHVETNSWISHIGAQSMFEVPVRKLLFFTFHIWHNPEAHDLKQSVRSQERAIVIKWRCYGYLHNKPAYPCTSMQYHQLVDLQHLLISHHKWNQQICWANISALGHQHLHLQWRLNHLVYCGKMKYAHFLFHMLVCS